MSTRPASEWRVQKMSLQCGRDNIVKLRRAGTFFEAHQIAAE